MKRTHRKNGFILLLVVAIIPLVGAAAIALTYNSRHILATTRRSTLKTQARLAAESGAAWLITNRAALAKTNWPVTLEMPVDGQTVTCRIEQANSDFGEPFLTVTGTAADRRFSSRYVQILTLKQISDSGARSHENQ